MQEIKVLLVDDEEEFVRSLAERIEMRELGSEVALDGEEALCKLKEKLPDVMILDFKMPGIDGLGVLDQIKRAYPGVQVIMLTAHRTPQVERKARELGAFDCLQKPVGIDRLTQLIQKAYAFKQKRGRTATAADPPKRGGSGAVAKEAGPQD